MSAEKMVRKNKGVSNIFLEFFSKMFRLFSRVTRQLKGRFIGFLISVMVNTFDVV